MIDSRALLSILEDLDEEMLFPDFSESQEITINAGSSYTLTQDSLVFLRLYAAQDGKPIYLQINGINIYEKYNDKLGFSLRDEGLSSPSLITQFYLSKGTKLSVSNSTIKAYIIAVPLVKSRG